MNFSPKLLITHARFLKIVAPGKASIFIRDAEHGETFDSQAGAHASGNNANPGDLSALTPFIGPLPLARYSVPAAKASSVSPAPVSLLDGSGAIAAGAPATSLTQAQVDDFETGFGATLTAMQSNLVAQVFAEKLPLLGDNLQAASGSAVQLQFITTLKNAIVSGLGTLTGSATYTEAQVEGAINSALSAAGITGAGASLDLADMADVKLNFVTAKAFAAIAVPVEGDIGLPNLGFTAGGNAQSALGYTLNFGSGIDAAGFYVGTAGTTFNVQAATTLPGGYSASAELGSIPFAALNNPVTPTNFTGTFNVALKDADGRIRNGDLGGDLLDATLSGNATINLKLASALPAAAVMPKLGSDFGVAWTFANAPVDPADNNADFGNAPVVSFANNTVNLGSFFDGFASDALQTISDITAPLQPVIDILTAPIPILSDLGSTKVTLLDFAGVEPETVSAIEGLSDIIDLVQLINGFTGNDGVQIQIGSVRINGDLRSELAADVDVDVLSSPALSGQDPDLNQFLNSLGSLGGGGLSFPLLTVPKTIGEFFLGKDNAELFEYAPAPVGFDFAYSQYFPVLGVIGVTVGGQFGFSFKFDIGFDTQGVRDFVAGGSTDASKVFNGFFVRAFDDANAPVTGFSVSAGVTAGVEANIGIANAGVEGDLTATVTFNFDTALDPDGDGKIRGDTLLSTPVGDLFDPTGELTTGLRAYLEVGISPFSIEFDFESPRITLLNFEGDTTQPVLANESGSDVLLNVGPRSAQRLVGNLVDRPETYFIDVVTVPIVNTTHLSVKAFKLEQNFNDLPARIVGDGGEKSDKLEVAAGVNIPVVFTGGASRDVLVGGAAADDLRGDDGPDVLSGNGGIDMLLGGAGNDHLTGGAGADVLDGGADSDTASYS
ncbi:MAG: hypothetical protein ABMA13_23660, partial [Chthoniobacteraceae bacterium]